MPVEATDLVSRIEADLKRDGTSDAALLAVLDRVLAHFDCPLGTLHELDSATGRLRLRAQRGVPGSLLPTIADIPIGKGMAGLTAQRRQPVQVCNLQKDTSGKARPGARETRMAGCLSVPMLVGEQLRGTLGVAKPVPYEYSEAETRLLLEVASAIGRHLGT